MEQIFSELSSFEEQRINILHNLRVGCMGEAQLGGSGSRSPLRLLSCSQLGPQSYPVSKGAKESTSKLTHLFVDRPPFFTGYWSEACIPWHTDSSTAYLNSLDSRHLASNKSSDSRVREMWARKENSIPKGSRTCIYSILRPLQLNSKKMRCQIKNGQNIGIETLQKNKKCK